MEKFLETVTWQASSNEYILGTELTSRDVYGPATTTAGGDTIKKKTPTLILPKAENAQATKEAAKPSVLVVEHPHQLVLTNAVAEESDYAVEI
uniref:Uncharacterized protein n=1 Tax=Romanomermis culicivorax TaxID=13658 RepID=A0A915JJ78_ROMCU